MAAVWAFRIGVKLMPLTLAGWRYVQSPGLDKPFRLSEHLKKRLADPGESDAALSQAVSQENGYSANVATITGDFEVRRVQLEFTATGPAILDEDVRVVTFHHIKLSGGAPISTWDAADFAALNDIYSNWWTSMKVWYPTGFSWTAIRYYKEGPNIVPPQPPVHQQELAAPGTSGNPSLPPQVACSVTEIAGQKKNWGRFYLPAPATANATSVPVLTNAGRPAPVFQANVADFTDAMYEAALTSGKPHVVYRKHLPAGRPHQGSTELPDRPANAQTVDQIQVDDVFDVIRSRRWENATLRTQRAIGTAEAREGIDRALPPQLEVPQAQATSEGDESPEAVQSP